MRARTSGKDAIGVKSNSVQYQQKVDVLYHPPLFYLSSRNAWPTIHVRCDDRAVTPVVSTILLVAIVVVLATVIAGAGLGVASAIASPAPQTSFEFTTDDATGDVVVMTVAGDTVSGDQLRFSGAALEKTTHGSITEWAGKDVRAGSSAVVNVNPSETLRLIWQSPTGRTEAVLAEYDVPSDVSPVASVDSITAPRGQTWVKINNIQFSRVNNGDVYVVVEKTPRRNAVTGITATESTFSTNGGELNVTGLGVNRRANVITVTLYETDSKSVELATSTCTIDGRFGRVCQ